MAFDYPRWQQGTAPDPRAYGYDPKEPTRKWGQRGFMDAMDRFKAQESGRLSDWRSGLNKAYQSYQGSNAGGIPVVTNTGPSDAWKALFTTPGYQDLIQGLKAAIPGFAAPGVEFDQKPYGPVFTDRPWKTGSQASVEGRGRYYTPYATMRAAGNPNMYAYVPFDDPNTALETEGMRGLYGTYGDPLTPSSAASPYSSNLISTETTIPGVQGDRGPNGTGVYIPDRATMLPMAEKFVQEGGQPTDLYTGVVGSGPAHTSGPPSDAYPWVFPSPYGTNTWETLPTWDIGHAQNVEAGISGSTYWDELMAGGGSNWFGVPGLDTTSHKQWMWGDQDRTTPGGNWWNSLFPDPTGPNNQQPTDQPFGLDTQPQAGGAPLSFGQISEQLGGIPNPAASGGGAAGAPSLGPSDFYPPTNSFVGGFPSKTGGATRTSGETHAQVAGGPMRGQTGFSTLGANAPVRPQPQTRGFRGV